jgi:hypothetical protein
MALISALCPGEVIVLPNRHTSAFQAGANAKNRLSKI